MEDLFYFPTRVSKLLSPKRTTPKRRPTESGIPKSQTPPVHKRLNSSFDVNPYEHFSVSPQRSYKVSNSLKNSPVSVKKNSSNIQQSPLRENNIIIHKVKPMNLVWARSCFINQCFDPNVIIN